MFSFSTNGLEQLLQDNSSHFSNDLIYLPQDDHFEHPIWVVTQYKPIPVPCLSYLHYDDVDGVRPLSFALEYHLQEVAGDHNNVQVLQKIVRVQLPFWKDFTESAKVMQTLICGGVPSYKERKSDLMTERRMLIGSIPILHEFVYNVNNLKSFSNIKDYQEIDTLSDNWFGRYPEEPEMSLNRELDAIRNRLYKRVPTVPFPSDVPNVKWDKVSYWSFCYTGQEKWQETHRRIDEHCKRFGLTNFQEPTRVMCSFTPHGKTRDELCPHCSFHPCAWEINSDHIVHNVKSMRGGIAYTNHERRFLAYRLFYYILYKGYSPTNERVCLPDCGTQAIKREWQNPPGEKYTGFIPRRRRRPVLRLIRAPQVRAPAAVARSICRPRKMKTKIKVEKSLQEVIEIEDEIEIKIEKEMQQHVIEIQDDE
jgi:hypothetical protein